MINAERFNIQYAEDLRAREWHGNHDGEDQAEREAAKVLNTHCKNCGGFCPSGTLANGFCDYCDLIDKRIQVAWGKFGIESCLVDHVSRSGTLYARRWNKRQGEWTSARPVEFYKGWRKR